MRTSAIVFLHAMDNYGKISEQSLSKYICLSATSCQKSITWSTICFPFEFISSYFLSEHL